jgi:hypothetical protein
LGPAICRRQERLGRPGDPVEDRFGGPEPYVLVAVSELRPDDGGRRTVQQAFNLQRARTNGRVAVSQFPVHDRTGRVAIQRRESRGRG